MTDSAIEQLLQQHFSIDALQQAPAPLRQALGLSLIHISEPTRPY